MSKRISKIYALKHFLSFISRRKALDSNVDVLKAQFYKWFAGPKFFYLGCKSERSTKSSSIRTLIFMSFLSSSPMKTFQARDGGEDKNFHRTIKFVCCWLKGAFTKMSQIFFASLSPIPRLALAVDVE